MINPGQLIITGIQGCSLTDEEREFLESSDIGGVLLFSHNYESPAQLAELINSIQTARQEYPLFIAVDQEGGRVNRFTAPFTHFPSMSDIALIDSPKLCYEIARIVSEELMACGVNVNFAPVCDVVTNQSNTVIGDRAFGSDPEIVAKFVSAMIRGYKTHSVIPCAKHFPGHGSTSKDSHHELPYVKKSLAELEELEFIPFEKAIKSRVDMVMMGHLVVDSIDQELPCTLSPNAYSLLRKRFKFSGLIVTDDMQMGAIAKKYSTEAAAVMAIKAGADIVEYRDFPEAKAAYKAIKEAIKTKELKNSDIQDKLNRVQNVKKTYLKDYSPVYIPDIPKSFRASRVESFLADLNKLITDKKAQA
jgi:beta-N-acetylhexosaminidase